MRKVSIKAVFQITKSEYRRMITDPRNIVVLSMYLVFYEMILKTLIQMGQKMGKPIQILEPFLALCSSEAVMIMLPLVFIIIISDFPRTDHNFRFYIIRAGKLNWMLGQMAYAFLASVTYMAAAVLMTGILALPYSYTGNAWSGVATKYHLMFPEEVESMVYNLINARLYNQTMPAEAFFHTFFLYCLYLFLLSVICFAAFMFCRRTAGILISGIIIIIGEVLTDSSNAAAWYMPTAHAVVWKHFDMVFRRTAYPISCSYLYFVSLIAAGIVIVLAGAKYRNFDAV